MLGHVARAIQQARVRARQRLIGAAVLVVIGIVGFPLVFETQPRPIPDGGFEQGHERTPPMPGSQTLVKGR